MDRDKLYEICDKTNTSRKGMDTLVEYYKSALGWSEERAVDYAIELFENGTIEQIKFLGRDGKEI